MRYPFSDPLRRCRVPKDLGSITTVRKEAEVDPTDVGMAPDAAERIWRSVERLYKHGMHPAIGLCLRRDGRVILDRAIGHATGNGPGESDEATRVLVTPDSPFLIASASKAVTAMLAHLADERGLLRVNDPVATYIPEFAKHGKGSISIAHVLSHRAGVPNLPREVLDLNNIADRDFIVATMCDAKPQWRPGRVVAYHAVSGGFVIAEILQRVTGVSVRDFLRTEVLEPLGFKWGNYGVATDEIDEVVRSYATGPLVPPPISTMLQRALGLPVEEVTEALNDPRMLTGIAPAVNIVTTASEHAMFYDMLRMGGAIDGVRIFSTATIRRAIAEQNWFEPDLTLGIPMRYSLGFMLGRKIVSFFGPNTEHAFGHNGYTNIVGWADPQRRVAAALMTSGKPILGTHLLDFLAVPREIAHQCPADGLESSPLHKF